jgi:peptide/nickel transport system substrate-binding protein
MFSKKKVVFLTFISLFLVANVVVLPMASYGQSQKLQGPIRGGVLRTSSVFDVSIFDPHRLSSMRIHDHSAAVFNSLVRTDPMKEEVSVKNMIPDLAERWQISPDGKTYLFHLRRGVKFHDGRPFTSKDVKYSLDKLQDPKRSVYPAYFAPIDSVEIMDDHTVRVRLIHPYPHLLVYLSSPYVVMEPEHLKDVNPKSTDFLVGTGPFKFKELVPGKVTIYERNPDYFIKGLPYLDRFEIYLLSHAPMVDAFIGGNLDVCGNMRAYLDADVAHVLKIRKYAPEAVIGQKPALALRGVFFSFARKGPWNDVRVRRAMAKVIDYHEVVVPAAGGPELGAIEGAGLVPFDAPGAFSKEEVAKAYGVDKPLEQRIIEAKRLMKEAGYPDGFELDGITRAAEQPMVDTMSYLADVWKRHLNINLKVRPLTPAIHIPLRDKGDYEVTFEGSAQALGTGAIDFLNFFVSGALMNFSKWSNKEFDALVDQLVRETNEAKMVELARKAQSVFYAELPFLVLGRTCYGTAWRPDLRTGWPPKEGLVIQPGLHNLPSIDRIWFEGSAQRWMKTK